MLAYQYDRTRIHTEETNTGTDIEFNIRVLDVNDFVPKIKAVKDVF